MILRRLFSWFLRPVRANKPFQIKPTMLAMEALEERMVPASHTLSIVSPELVGRVPDAELAGTTVITLDASGDAIGQLSRARRQLWLRRRRHDRPHRRALDGLA